MGSAAERVVLAAALLCGRLFDGIRGGELCETPTAAGPPPHPPRVSLPTLGGCELPAERGGQRSKGSGSFAPVPPRRPSYDTNRVVPSPGRRSGGCLCEQRCDTAWEAPDQRTDVFMCQEVTWCLPPSSGSAPRFPPRTS